MDAPKTSHTDYDRVKEWESKFYACPADHLDESEYQYIVGLVNAETQETGIISRDTFRRILKWKDPRERVIKNVRWAEFATTYAPRIRLVASKLIAEHHKLFILVWDADTLNQKLPVLPNVLAGIRGKAYGIGVPVGSTILHFLFPTSFPIMDIRVAETLYYWGKIESPDRNDPHKYYKFRDIMTKAMLETKSPLHVLDRAFFAYHRDIIQPAMNDLYRSDTGKNISIEVLWQTRQIVINKLKTKSTTIQSIF